jgi:hypothetical protein
LKAYNEMIMNIVDVLEGMAWKKGWLFYREYSE